MEAVTQWNIRQLSDFILIFFFFAFEDQDTAFTQSLKEASLSYSCKLLIKFTLFFLKY